MPHPSLFFLNRDFLRISGSDRTRYLNGQITQNILSLPPGQSLPSCVTDAKGRLQAEIWVSSSPDALWLDTPSGCGEFLLGRLEKYAIADDVSFSLETETRLLHCLVPPNSHPVLSAYPAKSASRLGIPGWDLRLPKDTARLIEETLQPEKGSAEDWESLRILHGIPAWNAELNSSVLPPEAGLDRTHIHYQKGCYIGQEILSRLKSVGRVHRKLTRWKWSSPEIPPPGTPILAKPASSLQCEEAGHMTSATMTPEGPRGLGYLKLSFLDATFQLPSGEVLLPVSTD